MNLIPTLLALVLSAIALSGQRGLLWAIAIAVMVGVPVSQRTGLRSAVYVQEVVILFGSLAWLLRRSSLRREALQSSMEYHQYVIIAYIVAVTFLGYVSLGLVSQAPHRSALAGLRYGAIALAYVIPASIPMSQGTFVSVMRAFYVAVMGLLVLSVLEAAGLIDLSGHMRMAALRAGGIGLGGFNRACTGTLAQYAIFVCLLLMQLKRLPLVVGIPSLVCFLGLTLASLSRTNAVSLTVFAIALIGLHKHHRLRNMMFVMLGLLAGTGFILSSPAMAERFATIASRTEVRKALETGGRLHGWLQALAFLRTNYYVSLIGSGFDMWGRVLTPHVGLAAGHNVYLHVWGELGLVGGSIYLAFFARFMVRCRRAMRHATGDAAKIAGLTFCLLVSLAVGNLSADLFYPTVTMIASMYATMFLFGAITARLRHPSSWVAQALEGELDGEGTAHGGELLTAGHLRQ